MATASQSTKRETSEPKSDLDELKDHVAAILEDFGALKATTAKLAASQAKKHLQRVSEMADTASEKAGDYRDLAIEKVRERPLAALGAAALAGFLVASLRKR